MFAGYGYQGENNALKVYVASVHGVNSPDRQQTVLTVLSVFPSEEPSVDHSSTWSS